MKSPAVALLFEQDAWGEPQRGDKATHVAFEVQYLARLMPVAQRCADWQNIRHADADALRAILAEVQP